MTTATFTAEAKQRTGPTVAELLTALGDVPAERVWLAPYPATEEDVVWMDEHTNRLCELVDGVLVEKPMAMLESVLAMLIVQELLNFVRPRRLGTVSGPDGMMKLLPTLIRIPDVAYVRRQTGGAKIPNARVPAIAPTLAVEVLSDGNTRREMQRKLSEYFAAGTELVWIIDPKTRTTEIHTGLGDPKIVGIDGTLDGDRALPGFTLSMKELFEELDRQFEAH